MKSYPLLFEPVFKHRIWGGQRLQEWFEECPQDQAEIGEAWVLSDHGAGPSLIQNGVYRGYRLTDIIAKEPSWFPPGMSEFPLLFKIIDAAKDLSVQVHPDDAYGLEHAGERGKTECWWVLDADNEAKIVYGHSAQKKEDFVSAVEANQWDDLLNYQSVRQGDFWFVPAGKVHALGAGTMVLEVQQSSDTTYRVYDYNRRDGNGKLRDLHLEDAYNVISFPDEMIANKAETVQSGRMKITAPSTTSSEVSGGLSAFPAGTMALADCPFFQVGMLKLEGSAQLSAQEILVVCPTDTNVTLETDSETLVLKRGYAALLPRNLVTSVTGSGTLLITTVPSQD